jgi:hypothetical protein
MMPFWDELDGLNLQGELRRWLEKEPGASIWPWESDNPDVQAVWERLTRPGNLAALEDWGRDMRDWGTLAIGCTGMAIETCRLRDDGVGGVRPVIECTPVALLACRRKYAKVAAAVHGSPTSPGAAPALGGELPGA